ncbi:exodeoxyribonuclease III [Candidatus Thiodictyon syntrophicum]|jgi:exodeoxyribonuclease-3|uniref:Exodeoxyribonuclease III n=1 Tax=Candidatus Thiodictyon syntrophicum TaxID=1166950 RepID=A0A2K8UCU2_9GAMM|nr:exodeoxyribonuclease III [Candidatus Thiodictyon syntrophicum]AUB83317.1 exodeoxyribonuclease III [Candidatus Thiodictyon syntrophicum]
MLTICSFNINGIRARPHQLEALRAGLDPDILGLQECKVVDEEFPLAMVEGVGYRAHCHGQKGHYGVALLSKTQPLAVTKGFPSDPQDAQRRAITGRYALAGGGEVTVINGYFPQGEGRDHPVKFPGKAAFYRDLAAYLRESFSPDQNLVVMGDMNVAPLDLDIGIGADNAKRWLREGKCSFLPEEREWLKVVMDWGLHDAYRVLHPAVDDRFSWFDYRSKGFEREPRRGLRIDLILVSAPLKERLREAGIDYALRAMDRPSDHCPVWASFDLESTDEHR